MKAFITGSSKGLGKALATVFASHGHSVFLHGRSEADLTKLSRELNCGHICHDLADVSGIGTLHDYLRKHEIDVLINNAAIYQGYSDDPVAVARLINTNLTSGILLMKGFYDYRKSLGGGAIVNINSVAGVYPNAKEAFYCASKFGLTGFVQSMQEKCSFDNIRVYEYFFGGITTKMTEHRADHKLLIDPAEAAQLIYHNLTSYTSLCSLSQKVKRLRYN